MFGGVLQYVYRAARAAAVEDRRRCVRYYGVRRWSGSVTVERRTCDQ